MPQIRITIAPDGESFQSYISGFCRFLRMERSNRAASVGKARRNYFTSPKLTHIHLPQLTAVENTVPFSKMPFFHRPTSDVQSVSFSSRWQHPPPSSARQVLRERDKNSSETSRRSSALLYDLNYGRAGAQPGVALRQVTRSFLKVKEVAHMTYEKHR